MHRDVTVSHSVYASVAHRYWNSEWSHEKNLQVYGKDASEEGLGSNLRLEITQPLNDGTDERSLIAEVNRLKSMVDHQCLFNGSSSFGSKPSTLENISLFLMQQLTAQNPRASLVVWESEHLACAVRRGNADVVLRFKVGNLTVEAAAPVAPESGIAVPRAPIAQAVRELYVKLNEIHQPDMARWSENLFRLLGKYIEGLQTLRIDLGRHESVVVHS